MRVPSLEPLPYALPTFEPHITISSFPSSVPLESLQSALKDDNQALVGPLPVAFSALSTGDVFFRSVLIDVEPTSALNALREHIQKALPTYEARSPRYPHLSLFYISEEYASDRGKIRDALWSAYGVSLTGRDPNNQAGGESHERIAFDLSSAAKGHPFAGFDASELWIVRCDGATEDWVIIDKIQLTDRSN